MTVLLALGANLPGLWGMPAETLNRAIREINRPGLKVMEVSNYYASPPMGPVNQPSYVNCVVSVDCAMPPDALLRVLQAIERAAGRRAGRRWSARPLDIDILDYKRRHVPGVWLGPRGNQRSPLVIPHPGLLQRAFVLAPLLDIAPRWRHPLSHVSAADALRAQKGAATHLKVLPQALQNR